MLWAASSCAYRELCFPNRSLQNLPGLLSAMPSYLVGAQALNWGGGRNMRCYCLLLDAEFSSFVPAPGNKALDIQGLWLPSCTYLLDSVLGHAADAEITSFCQESLLSWKETAT